MMRVDTGSNGEAAAGGLPAAVGQVLRADGEVAGVGFLADQGLLVTCAHVVQQAGGGSGDQVWVRFPHVPGAPRVRGQVVDRGWREPDGGDVAVVRLESTPPGAQVLALGSAAGCRGRRVRSFGFPAQAPPEGHYGYAIAGDLLPERAGSGVVLQLTAANDLTRGFSGAPVVDEVTGLVVGMVAAIAAPDAYRRGLSIAYATPTDTLRQVWPDLGVQDVYPYRGLEPFTAQDAGWFHGRDDAVERVLAGLAAHHLLLLLGPSGAGKSSLVQAGLLPALAAGRLPGSHRWLPVLARPGQDLLVELEACGLPEAGRRGIAPAALSRLAAEPDRQRLLLVIDQFEELLTHRDAGVSRTQLAAVEQLTTAIGSVATLSAVLVMRDDFYPRLAALAPQLLEAATPGLLNTPATLTTHDLHAIITRPAETAGARFEAGLPERIINDVLAADHDARGDRQAPVGMLPLLELSLSQLWDDRFDGQLTHQAYERNGQVTGSLTTWCETALDQLPDHQRPIARRILTALVQPADPIHHTPAVRQQVPLSVLRDLATGTGSDADEPSGPTEADQVLTTLTGNRIITTRTLPSGTNPPPDTSSQPPPSGGQIPGAGGEPVAELIHDALIHDWHTLRTWVEQDQQFHHWLRRATEQNLRWSAHQNPGDLLHGTDLAEGLDWSRQRHLPRLIDTFLTASYQRQRAATRRTRRLNAILATLLAVALVAAGIALVQRQNAITAEENALAAQQVALSRQLAAQSEALLSIDPDLASLLAIHAYYTSPTDEATASLTTAAALPLRHTVSGETPAFSPEGSLFATRGGQHIVLWDLGTRKPAAALEVGASDTSPTRPFAFSPDGTLLAVPATDGSVELWDTGTGERQPTLTGGPTQSTVWDGPAPAFSPDGTLVANTNADGTVQVWNLATGLNRTIRGIPGVAQSIAFSPDGSTLATGSNSHGYAAVRLWDARTGEPAGDPPSGDTGIVSSTMFSADGNTLATATITDTDVTVRLWDAASGETEATRIGLNVLRTAAASATLSPDLRIVAIGSSIGSVQLLDVATGAHLATLPGYPSSTSYASQAPSVFSRDGSTLATATIDERVVGAGTTREDRVVRLWDVPIGTPLDGQRTLFPYVGFSPDGSTLATVSLFPSGADPTATSATVDLWDTTTGERLDHNLPDLPFPSDGARGSWAVGLGPNRNILATASDGSVELRDIHTGELIDHSIPRGAISLGFSPSGTTLAITGSGGRVDLWDVDAGHHRATIRSEDTSWTADLAPVFSLDGNTLAATDTSGIVSTWDLPTEELQSAIIADDDRDPAGVALSPDGATLATTSSDGTVQLWDPTTGGPLATLPGQTGVVVSAAFSPDGTTLATGGIDRTVRLWDVRTGRTVTTLGHVDPVSSLAFSPDSTTLATTTLPIGSDEHPARSGTLQLWDVPATTPADAISEICQALGSYSRLTPQEQDQYLPPVQEHSRACSSRTVQTDPSGPTQTRATFPPTSAGPAAAAEQAVLDTYRGMWDAYILAGRRPVANPDDPRLQRYAAGEALQTLREDLTSMRDEGLIIEGSVTSNPEVTNLTPAPSPTRARVLDCLDATEMTRAPADGMPQEPVGLVLVIADLEITDDGWRVTSLAAGSC